MNSLYWPALQPVWSVASCICSRKARKYVSHVNELNCRRAAACGGVPRHDVAPGLGWYVPDAQPVRVRVPQARMYKSAQRYTPVHPENLEWNVLLQDVDAGVGLK